MKHSLITYWHLDPVMTLFLLGICIGYFYLTDFILTKKTIYFIIGYLLIILAIASPLHFLGENYLMSAHMASHVILLLIAAPLLLMGIPENDHQRLDAFSKWMAKHPWLPWMTGVCVMWFWHIPVVFNRLFEMQDSPGKSIAANPVNFLSDLHLISLVLAGLLFSWPVIGPVKSRRIVPVNAVLYLSAACVFCSILGLMITFSPSGIFTHYENITDRFGFLQMIRNENGLSVQVDRQMAGLIMWVPGCLIYLSASMYLLMKWFKEKNDQPVFLTHQMEKDGNPV